MRGEWLKTIRWFVAVALLLYAGSLLPATSALGDEEDDDTGDEVEESEQPLQEVFQAELVYPQEEGELQVTLTPSFFSGAEEDQLTSRVGVEYGLTDDWQIGLEWDFFVDRRADGETASGVGDLEISTKLARMDWGENLHLAFGLEIALPIADIDKELTEGFIEYEPFVVIARDFPEAGGLQLFAQFGLAILHRVREPDDDEELEPAAHELEAHVGLFVPTKSAVATLELSYSDNTWNRDGEERELYLTPGVVWGFGESWEAGLGVPIGLDGEADDYGLIFTFSWEK